MAFGMIKKVDRKNPPCARIRGEGHGFVQMIGQSGLTKICYEDYGLYTKTVLAIHPAGERIHSTIHFRGNFVHFFIHASLNALDIYSQ